MRRKRTPEILWNSETVSRALDVCPARLMCLVRLELIPAPVILKDSALWHEWQHKTSAELQGN